MSIAIRERKRYAFRMELSSWDLFVLRHNKRGNLIVHFVSFLCFYGGPLLALIFRNPWFLLGFFSSGAIGAFGHYAFKDGGVNRKEASSSPQTVFYVTVMFYKIFRGTYWADVDQAFKKVASQASVGREQHS